MIKRLIGIIVVVAVVVIVVVTALQRDNFRSMVVRDELLDRPLPEAAAPADAAPGAASEAVPGSAASGSAVAVPQADSLASGAVLMTDSVTLEVTDSL